MGAATLRPRHETVPVTTLNTSLHFRCTESEKPPNEMTLWACSDIAWLLSNGSLLFRAGVARYLEPRRQCAARCSFVHGRSTRLQPAAPLRLLRYLTRMFQPAAVEDEPDARRQTARAKLQRAEAQKLREGEGLVPGSPVIRMVEKAGCCPGGSGTPNATRPAKLLDKRSSPPSIFMCLRPRPISRL